MCLFTVMPKPFVAKKDIVCYKYLKRGLVFCEYFTPYQGTKVELGKEIIPEDTRDKGYGYEYGTMLKYAITDGFIHAALTRNVAAINSSVAVKAIIPEGTEFYINDNVTEICAKKLLLTEEVLDLTEVPYYSDVLDEILCDYFDEIFKPFNDDVGIGYYRLADGTYLNPKYLTPELKDEVIGVVGYTHEGGVGIVGLDENAHSWRSIDDESKAIQELNSPYTDFRNTKYEDIVDYDGRGNTDNVLNKTDYSYHKYPAFGWVNDYETKGTKKGDWYLGAKSEVEEVICKNMLPIAVALKHLRNQYCQYISWNLITSTEIGDNFNTAFYGDGSFQVAFKGVVYDVIPFMKDKLKN